MAIILSWECVFNIFRRIFKKGIIMAKFKGIRGREQDDKNNTCLYFCAFRTLTNFSFNITTVLL